MPKRKSKKRKKEENQILHPQNLNPTFEDLIKHARITIGHRLTERVRKQWIRNSERWHTFCIEYNIETDDFDEINLITFCMWIVWFGDNGWSSLRGYIYSVRDFSIRIMRPINVDKKSMPTL
eukprot:370030_1